MISLLFSYSHRDENLRNELEIHLAMLKRQETIQTWHDRRITAGSEFDSSISEHLEQAQIILLLVSAYFLASDYCYNIEMTRALEKHHEGSACVIPVILHPCDWQSASFGALRATPTDGKAVSMFANPHEAFAIIAKDIREAAAKFAPKSLHSATPSPSTAGQLPGVSGIRSSNLRIQRDFSDHEQDQFLEESFEYIARYFEGSLAELSKRNPHLQTRFRRIDANSFTAAAYADGKRATQCSVWIGGAMGGRHSRDIAYSAESTPGNSFNDSLTVTHDGYALFLNSLMAAFRGSDKEHLSQEGAAEHYWSRFIGRLQQ